jgi:hypothetical protein
LEYGAPSAAINTLDHCAIVVLQIWLKQYCQHLPMFPLQLSPVEEQHVQTHLFEESMKTCKEVAPMRCKYNNWILEESWRLIAHNAMLCCIGILSQTEGIVCTAKLAPLFARTRLILCKVLES